MKGKEMRGCCVHLKQKREETGGRKEDRVGGVDDREGNKVRWFGAVIDENHSWDCLDKRCLKLFHVSDLLFLFHRAADRVIFP